MSDTNNGPLVAAVNAVMADVGYVRATGFNQQQRYTYTSDEDLLKALQPAMASHGLALIPVALSEVQRDIAYETKAGSAMWRVSAVVTYNLCHTSGAAMGVSVYAEGADTADKCASKLMTSAYKYALRQAFAIPTGDDSERDVKTGQEAMNGTPNRGSPPPPPSAPAANGRPTRATEKPKPAPATGAAFHATPLIEAMTSVADLSDVCRQIQAGYTDNPHARSAAWAKAIAHAADNLCQSVADVDVVAAALSKAHGKMTATDRGAAGLAVDTARRVLTEVAAQGVPA